SMAGPADQDGGAPDVGAQAAGDASPLGGNVAALTVSDLRTDNRTAPLGIDSAAPRLSWILHSSTRGDAQTAYRIVVASTPALLAADTGDLWDSGKRVSVQQNHVLYAGKALTSSQAVTWKVRAWDGSDVASSWSAPSTWTMGIVQPTDWQAKWITGPLDTNLSTLLRKEFAVGAGLTRAVIHVCGLGQYEMSLNGSKVGSYFLTPGWTNYATTSLYDTYDVTSQLQPGATNAIGLLLGNGMYSSSNVSASGPRYALWTGSSGPRKAIVHIRLEYADGSVQIVGSDATWKVSLGPITFSSIYGGEDYDARREQPWNTPGFDSSSWAPAALFAGTSGTLKGASSGVLPLTTQDVFTPIHVTPLGPGVIVYDFGQNAAQIPELVVTGPAGARVRIRPGELLNADGTVSQVSSSPQWAPTGPPSYMDFTLKGSGSETFSPKFYYYGYRYLQLNYYDANGATTGTLPTLVSLKSKVVSSSSPAVGTFTCSSKLFNDIRTLIGWAQRSNTVSIFTDCPHREKLGWLEETYLNGPALRYEHDLAVLYNKIGNDMAEGQQPNGMVPTLVPHFTTLYGGAFGDSPEWGSAIIQAAWQQYQADGDVTALKALYSNMKSYLGYLTTKATGGIVNYGLGDWYDLGPGTLGVAQLTPVSLTDTATYYADAQTMAAVATLLGNTMDAATYTTLAGQIRGAFNNTFYNKASKSYSTNSQTANAMPLALGMVDPGSVPGVVDSLVKGIKSNGYKLTSGDVGYRYLLRALADNSRSDVVVAMNNQSDRPGYGYNLAKGATSLTESWTAEGRSSQDHFMLGQLMEWFYSDLAGIRQDPAGPGFERAIIKPGVVGDITSASASHDSVRGVLRSDWTRSDTLLTLKASIPPGSTATLYVPTLNTSADRLAIRESGTTIWKNGAATGAGTGIAYDHSEGTTVQNSYIAWKVGSGTYDLSADVLYWLTDITAKTLGQQVTLSWTAASRASGYQIERATKSGGPYTSIATVPGTAYTDTNLTFGVPYYYVVAAQFVGGGSVASAEVSVTPVDSLPVANFGFEAPVIGTFAYSPAGGAWAFSPLSGSNGSGITSNGSPFTLQSSSAPEGVQAAFIQGTGTISQAISGFKPGLTYTLIFSAAERGPGATWNIAGQTWNVTRDGVSMASYAPPKSATSYTDYTATFTATATTHTLSFVGTNANGGDNTVFFDNIRIVVGLPPP
ncbi:MAG: family 78 glycoside hydrolase catalytic domain, partial [Myxococcota bacterium]|nr:family 78 glycoside hydrolase catalytic domain [Myxococcota bacterium]